MDSSLIGLTLQETYRHVSLAVHADLSFDLSFDTAVLENLCHWFDLQTHGRGIPVSTTDFPLWDIFITTPHRGSEDLLFAILFIALFLMAGSSRLSIAFLLCLPYVRDILSLQAWLHTYPHMGL